MNRQQRRQLAHAERQPGAAASLNAIFATAVDHHSRGSLPEAIAAYERVFAAQDDFPGLAGRLAHACYNLANTSARTGDLASAVSGYHRAISALPDFAEAHGNLIRALLASGAPADAFDAAIHALDSADTPEIRRLMVRSAGSARQIMPPNGRQYLARAFREGWARMVDVAYAASPTLVADLDGDTKLDRHETNALLLAHLESAPIADERLEYSLTKARMQLLLETGDHPTLRAAIARQCFINEYVWPLAIAEEGAVLKLRAEFDRQQRPPSETVVALAMYQPLSSIPHSERLLDHEWPEVVGEVLRQQLIEPKEELSLRGQVERLGLVTDQTSLAVQGQYEENPYPRWVVSDQTERTSLGVFLRRLLPAGGYTVPDTATVNVLIAGCGTGQHSITTARRFPDAKITAVDLSRSSLAYAIRKTQAAGVSITYRQADILALSDWPERFDVIESSGVLHHLREPVSGWRVLVGLLKTGGFMRIGLYSRRGRSHIAAARNVIGAASLPTGDIRTARARLLALPKDETARGVVNSYDFYSMSSCRDLLFHVQEHVFDLVEIKAALESLGLWFIGFDLPEVVRSQFRARFGSAELDLIAWDKFETDHPSIFTGMYQFWVVKRA